MDSLKSISVFCQGKKVGTIARYNKVLSAFQYTEEWLNDGFSISPFSLPLSSNIFTAKADPFEGMFGVFSDSLPDGWGRLLVDRLMRKNRIDPVTVSSLERLAIVGESGLGALTYEPAVNNNKDFCSLSLDSIAEECKKILNTEYSDNLDELFS